MNIVFAPLLPFPIIIFAIVVALVIIAISVLARQRGALIRSAGLALLVLAMLNPIFTDEEREPVQNIVSIIADRSQSQLVQNRSEETDQAIEMLEQQLARYKNIDVRIKDVEHTNPDNPATNLFRALSDEISDIPADRLAGTIIITDGQVHDIPKDMEHLGITSPIHGLITGKDDEMDLRVEITNAPRFGIVGETQEVLYKIFLDGEASTSNGEDFEVELKLNGEVISTEFARINEEAGAYIDIPRRGKNLIELSVRLLDGEVSESNNKAVVEIEGVRQNLRVLLVSGAPHSGERAWRNLLKSDTSIDLVHFTILRPPNRSDGTPIDELSLIAFPTRELFIEKIDDFDLIIFDRYQRLGVLSILYYDNIARYVEDGGALLIAAGPEYAGIQSIATTPLATVLPALPTGKVDQIGFYPRISEAGSKHPVSRNLAGGGVEPPQWGRWFRSIEVDEFEGNSVLNGPGGNPLLVLNRVSEGRVAMLLSDHGWLWSRGFEGGGPHVSLYRRIAHWLMKEPALEEEALFANATGNEIRVTRQTMADIAKPLTLISPSGATEELTFQNGSGGEFELKKEVTEKGLYEITDGELTTVVHVGAVDAREFEESVSTMEKLRPIVEQSKGLVHRIASNESIDLPLIVPVRQLPNNNNGRLLLRTSNETILIGVNQIPLLGGILGLAALLLVLSATWYREGR